MGAFLIILVVIGNLLLFSGALFGDLSDNGIAWFLALGAIAFDIYFIYSLVSKSSKNKSNGQSIQPSAGSTASGTGGTRATTPPEKDNTENGKLAQLKRKYTVPGIPSFSSAVDPIQKEMESYQCIDVLQTVNRVVSKRESHIKQLKVIRSQYDNMLSCPGCSSDKERIKYFNSNEEALEKVKRKYLDEHHALKKHKVKLLSKESRAFEKLRTVLNEISASQKITNDSGIAFNSFAKINASIPGDLFESDRSPIELNYGAYRFFLTPDVVLVYDKNNEFVTALEPMAVIIGFRERQKSVYASRHGSGEWTYSDNVIAQDSKLVSQGTARTSWLHTKKNGGPDLRYSYNPRYEWRTDTYTYTEFNIQIGQFNAVFSVSKGSIVAKLKPLVRDYCAISHRMNATPSLLRLLESTAKTSDGIENLINEYEEKSDSIICKEEKP